MCCEESTALIHKGQTMKELPNPTMPLSFIDVPRGSLHRNDHDAQKVSVAAQKTEARPALIV
jgi:hypothetical protein